MWPIVMSRRPHDKQHLAIEPADALKALLAIRDAEILASKQITIEECLKRSNVDTVIVKIDLPFGVVECDHCSYCNYKVNSRAQKQKAPEGAFCLVRTGRWIKPRTEQNEMDARRGRPTCTFCVHEADRNAADARYVRVLTCPCRPCRPYHPYRHHPCRRPLNRHSALQRSWPRW